MWTVVFYLSYNYFSESLPWSIFIMLVDINTLLIFNLSFFHFLLILTKKVFISILQFCSEVVVFRFFLSLFFTCVHYYWMTHLVCFLSDLKGGGLLNFLVSVDFCWYPLYKMYSLIIIVCGDILFLWQQVCSKFNFKLWWHSLLFIWWTFIKRCIWKWLFSFKKSEVVQKKNFEKDLVTLTNTVRKKCILWLTLSYFCLEVENLQWFCFEREVE